MAVGALAVGVDAVVAHHEGAGHGGVVGGVPHPEVAAQRGVVVAEAAALLLAVGLGQGVAYAVHVDVAGHEGGVVVVL